MNTSENSLIVGLAVPTVTEIADHAVTLVLATKPGPDGEVVGMLVGKHDHVVLSTDATFPTEEAATAHVEKIVEACVAWQDANLPETKADPSFTS